MGIKRKILKIAGEIATHRYPMWLIYKPHKYAVKGEDQRKILDVLQCGHVLLRYMGPYISSRIIPGFWSHVGLYVGDNKVVHAIASGVVEEDILSFLRADAISVIDPKVSSGTKKIAANNARAMAKIGIKYDYDFADDNGKVYCTEGVSDWLGSLYKDDYVDGVKKHPVLLPDGIANSKNSNAVLEVGDFSHRK